MNPKKAWSPLPDRYWNQDAARHLASRIGFSVHPDTVSEFHLLKPVGVVNKYLLKPRLMDPFPSIVTMQSAQENYRETAKLSREDRREKRKELQKLNREGYADYAVAWHRFAVKKINAPQEKLSLFFQNVWVVAFQGVKNVPALFEYQNRIRSNITLSYPEMCKSLTLTLAMGRYLNLNQNKAAAPNENFARELFELFTLGEGNYTEQDIKEAARALTGYQFRPDGTVTFRLKAHDSGSKTIFGKRGRHQLNDLLRLTFQQETAATFLPGEFLKFYLSSDTIDPEYIDELGTLWRKNGYSLPFLYMTVFNSRFFYESQFRGSMIKSPVHYYLGLHQDFAIDVLPLPRECVRAGRLMGQSFFNPPNVKGWEGGRHWINSATLAARRQVAETLLQPLNTKRLNADETRALKQAETHGEAPNYRIAYADYLSSEDSPEALARTLSTKIFATNPPLEIIDLAKELIEEDTGRLSSKAKRTLIFAAITSPSYQLC